MLNLRVARASVSAVFELIIDRDGVGGVEGESPIVKLRRQGTSNEYLDFNDNIFKTSGWVQQTKTLIDAGGGQYRENWNPSAVSSLVAGEKLIAEYSVNNPPIVGADFDYIEVVGLEDFVVDIMIPPLERPNNYDLLVEVRDSGALVDPDSSTINIDVNNQSGVSRSTNLSSTVMTKVATGRYRVTYTVNTNHVIEELIFTFTFSVAGNAQIFERVETVIAASETSDAVIVPSALNPDRI